MQSRGYFTHDHRDKRRGGAIPVALSYNLESNSRGFDTAYDSIDKDSIELADDLRISRIDPNGISPPDGSIGIGKARVKEMNQSSNGELHYLILELLKFRQHDRKEPAQHYENIDHDVRNHVNGQATQTTRRAISEIERPNITR